MHLLPARVLSDHLYAFHVQVLVLCIPREVVPQSSQENQGHKAAQEDDHHEAVKNAEHMYFVLEEVVFQIAVEALFKELRRWLPMH